MRNICISNWIDNLYLYHAAADMVICCGAYNTLLECMQGLPKTILSYSVQNPTFENEQQENILKLGKYYSIKHLCNLEYIEKMATCSLQNNDFTLEQNRLNMAGINYICNMIMDDINKGTPNL